MAGSGLVLPSVLNGGGAGDDAAADYGPELGMDGEEGSLVDDEAELVMLQKVVQQTIEKKKVAAAKKQAAMLEEFKAGAEKRASALETVINKVG